MQRHYSTVALDEQRRGLSNVIQLLPPSRYSAMAARRGSACVVDSVRQSDRDHTPSEGVTRRAVLAVAVARLRAAE